MAVTAPNISVSDATYAVTIRCTLRKLFLTPLTPRVHSALLYAAGRRLLLPNGDN